MKLIVLAGLFIFSFVTVSAQVKDSSGSRRRSYDSTMFASDDTLTRSDYLLNFEKVYQKLNKGNSMSQPLPAILEMSQQIDEQD